MYIKKLRLQHFGKYHKYEIELQKGINLIYGPNEAGKTTIKDFIVGMFYGIERLRGIAARTDEYTKREPLEGGGYSGSMELEKDGSVYRIDRSFRKDQKSLKLYLQDTGRELETGAAQSLQGSLIDLDKNGYVNTLCISSQGAAYRQELQEEFRQYLTNMQETHTGNLNLKDAYACLNEQKNALNRKEMESGLQAAARKQTDLSLETQLEELAEERQTCEEQLLSLTGRQEGTDASETEAEDGRSVFRMSPEEKKRLDPQLRQILNIIKVLLCFGVLALVLLIIYILPVSLYYKGWLTVIAAAVSLYVWIMVRIRRRKKQSGKTSGGKRNPAREEAVQKEDYRDRVLEYSQRLADIQVQENDLLKQNARQQEQKDRYDELKEKLRRADVELEAIELARSTIQELAGDIYDQYGPSLSRRVSDMVSRMTQGRYTDVRLDEQLRIEVRKEDRYLGAEFLSTGTLEQIYLAVRLAVAGEMSRSGMPLILDDVFGSYDDARLVNVLQCLADYPAEQILLFTAGDRLADILDQTDIDYNYVEV